LDVEGDGVGALGGDEDDFAVDAAAGEGFVWVRGDKVLVWFQTMQFMIPRWWV
jgi:hypothetical protein